MTSTDFEVPGPAPHPVAALRALNLAARRLAGAWLFAVAVVSFLAAASAGAVVYVLVTPTVADSYALLWGLITGAAVYNVTRFVPRAPRPTLPTVRPRGEDADVLSAWVATRAEGWHPELRFSSEPTIHVDQGALVVGLPLLLCLREPELTELVRDARELSVSDSRTAVGFAFGIARGAIGQGLRHRKGIDAWASRWLVRFVDIRISRFADAYTTWVDSLRAHRGPGWAATAAEVGMVAEGWDIVARRWLDPALRRGVWYADPFTGLRSFLAACEVAGVIDRDSPRPPGPYATNLLRHTADYERALVERLIEGTPHDDQPSTWPDHPHKVTEPDWRSTFATALEKAHRATGVPQPATLDGLFRLLEDGWGTTLTAAMGAETHDDGDVSGQSAGDPLEGVLEAAVSCALLDARVATMTWAWPFGTELRGSDGQVLNVRETVTGTLLPGRGAGGLATLRAWLVGLGVDLETPLWLAGGAEPQPEEPLIAFEAFKGMRTYHVVATDRAVRVLHRKPLRAVAEHWRMSNAGPGSVLSARMQAVQSGELTGQEAALEIASVVRAVFTPLVGGYWWKLWLRTPDGRFTIRGNGDGRDVEAVFALLLGERLLTRWLHANRGVLRARNWFGGVFMSLGSTGVLIAAILLVRPVDDLDRGTTLAFAGVCLVVTGLAFLPDLVATGVRRLRRTAPRELPPLTRDQGSV